MKPLRVVAGIILNQERQVLLAQRPPGKLLAGFWEFPGGKIESGESAQDALKRELKEELKLDIQIQKHLGVFPYTYEWGSIDLHVYEVLALNLPNVTEQVQVFKWIEPRNIDPGTLAAADILPLKTYVQDQSRANL